MGFKCGVIVDLQQRLLVSQCENLKAMKAFVRSKTDVEKTSSSDFNLVKFKDKALALIVECSD